MVATSTTVQDIMQSRWLSGGRWALEPWDPWHHPHPGDGVWINGKDSRSEDAGAGPSRNAYRTILPVRLHSCTGTLKCMTGINSLETDADNVVYVSCHRQSINRHDRNTTTTLCRGMTCCVPSAPSMLTLNTRIKYFNYGLGNLGDFDMPFPSLHTRTDAQSPEPRVPSC